MRALTLSVMAIAAVVLAAGSASAATPHPWCLIIQDQDDGWACGFDTFEQCRVEARSGNTGFCAQNPNYQAPAKPTKPAKRQRPR